MKLLVILFIISTNFVLAASTGTSLPWESPLETLQDSLTGPVAGAISLIAIVITGGMLVWGGELSGFAKTMVYVVLVIAVILGGSSFIKMFTSSGALM